MYVQHDGVVAVLELIAQEYSTVQEGVEWKLRRLAAEEARRVTSRVFSAYGRTLEMVL